MGIVEGDGTGEGHPDVGGEPVVHATKRVFTAPEARDGDDGAERVAGVGADAHESRHPLGEGEGAGEQQDLRGDVFDRELEEELFPGEDSRDLDAREAELKVGVRADPVVQAVLNKFPGAEITDLR